MKLASAISLAVLGMSTASAEYYEPAAFSVTDGFVVTPQVAATFRYDDNIFNVEQNALGSSIQIVKPSLAFGSDDGINQYGGRYELTAANYASSSDDNYIDHDLDLYAHTEFSAKQRTDFKLSVSNVHEDRGSGLTETGTSNYNEPLKYNEYVAGGYYQYGGMSAIMRLGGGANYKVLEYQNFTDNTKFSDYDSLKLFMDADYQVGSVTYLTLDIHTTDVGYDHVATGAASRDNRDNRALLGVKWEGLGKTTGTLKAGFQDKDFDSTARDDFSGATADIGVIWAPLQHSSLTAHINYAAEDSDTVGDYIETLGGSLVWGHDWTDKLYSSVLYMYTNEDYAGASREDDTDNVAVNVHFDVSRWLTISAGYEFTDKSSNADDISYDKNAVNCTVMVAL